MLNFQKTLLKSVKNEFSLNSYFSDEIKHYEEDMNIEEKKPIKESDFLLKLKNSSIILVADFHSYSQYQETFLRLIQYFYKKKNFCLGLETFFEEDQKHIDDFLSSKITEKTFLKKINYIEKWSFPWSNYKKIVLFAKKNKIPIIGINNKGSLEERDSKSSTIIKNSLKNYSSIFCLYGELHLHFNKIPQYLPEDSCIIHQNLFPITSLDRIYHLKKNHFCLLTTPIWTKHYTAHLWFEKEAENTDFIHMFLDEDLKNTQESLFDIFYSISESLYTFLSFNFNKNTLEDYRIYSLLNKKDFIKKIKKESEKKIFTKIAKENLTYAYNHHYYSYDLSLDNINILIGHHFYHCFFYKETTIPFKKYFFEYFYSYIFSKILNPYRRCLLYQDLVNKNYPYTNSAFKVLKEGSNKLKSHLESYYVGKYLGTLFGEYFYLKNYQSKDLFLKELALIRQDLIFPYFYRFLPKNFEEDFYPIF